MKHEFLPGTVRQRIRDIMDYSKVTQQSLSELADIPYSTLNDFLNQKTQTISSENVVKIAELFHVSTDFLLGLTNDPSPKNAELQALGLSRLATANLESRCFDPKVLSVILEEPDLACNLLQLVQRCSQTEAVGGRT